jgi:hypothetical protein
MYIVSVYVHHEHVSFRCVLTEVGSFQDLLVNVRNESICCSTITGVQHRYHFIVQNQLSSQAKSTESVQCSGVSESE